MSTLDWTALTLGLLIIATRTPALLWPERTREIVLSLLNRLEGNQWRFFGVVLIAIAIVITVLLIQTMPLIDSALLVISLLLAGAGTCGLAFPQPSMRFARGTLERVPPLLIRCSGALAIALGTWLIVLALT
jgi:uncharacterized protein YjeT (DUF2065 family)